MKQIQSFNRYRGRDSRKPAAACLWMQAGVVAHKPCFKDFLCTDCRFNLAMTRTCRRNEAAQRSGRPITRKSGGFMFWQDKLLQMPLPRRPCIHHMKGRIDFKACTKSYHCIDCEFDQFFQDRFKVYTRVEPVNFDRIKGFCLPGGYYLAANHVWVKLEDSSMVSIGVDDFAVRLLGKFETVSVPLMGKALKRGKPAFTLGRENNSTTFMSPVSGVVTDVNTHVSKDPGRINRAPYTDGWLITVFCPSLKQDLKTLMFMDSAARFMDGSAKRLYTFLEDKTGLKAANGGELVTDIYGSLTGVSWEDLVDRFLSGVLEPGC